MICKCIEVFYYKRLNVYFSSNQACEWRIEAGNITDAIRMEIIDAEIEYHADCVYDHGEVFDGNVLS